MGLGSRREIERWIEQGRVKVDGKIARLGQTDEAVSQVTVNGEIINLQQKITRDLVNKIKHKEKLRGTNGKA